MKRLFISLCIGLIIGGVMIKFHKSIIIELLSKINPKIVEELYPDFLSSVDSVFIEAINVSDDNVDILIDNCDSGMAIKKAKFDVKENILYFYLYKGIATDNLEYKEKFNYSCDMTKINEIILVGANGECKAIWKK